MKDQPVDDGIEGVFVSCRFREIGDAKFDVLTAAVCCAPGSLDSGCGKVEADGVISFPGKCQCRDSDPAARVENRASETPLTFQGGEFGLQFADIPAGISGIVRRFSVVELIPVDAVHIECWHSPKSKHAEQRTQLAEAILTTLIRADSRALCVRKLKKSWGCLWLCQSRLNVMASAEHLPTNARNARENYRPIYRPGGRVKLPSSARIRLLLGVIRSRTGVRSAAFVVGGGPWLRR